MAEIDTAGMLHMLSAHEERIQRLEDVTTELVGSVAEQNATLKAFSRQVQMMTDSVCEKLDDGMQRLSTKLGDISEISKDLAKENKVIEDRVQKLERQDDRDDVRLSKALDFKYQALYYLLSGAGGAASLLAAQWLKTKAQ